MKVTVNGLVFEGTAAEIYEVLFQLGYAVDKKDVPSVNPVPYTFPSMQPLPSWTHPIYVGDPPPSTYPQVWCGGGNNIEVSTPDVSDIIDKVIGRNDKALKKMTDD